MENGDYKVRLDVYEGPLDLLLYLIKKDEVDVYHIPLERITRQYMEYLDLMRMLDLNIAGDFLVMAATLMMIKSRMLLPVEDRGEVEEEEEEEDPRWSLVRQLVEYKKFKDAALYLSELEELQEGIVSSSGEGVELGPAALRPTEDVGLFDLIAAFNEALGRVREEKLTEIFAERVTVAEKIEVVLQRLGESGSVRFTELFMGIPGRQELICTFLALLELIRLNQARARQSGLHGDILIERAA